MLKFIKQYRFAITTLVLLALIVVFNRETGVKALNITGFSFKEMLLVIPPVFILLGLLDVWVPRDTMIRYMGEGSGLKGIILAIILGSAAAGPLYGAFPVAGVFLKKGVKFQNILIFIGAWSTTKIPMFLFELSALGSKFAWTRLVIDLPGIIIISCLVEKMLKTEEIKKIYVNAENL